MPEKGAPPAVHPIQRRVLKALGALSSPLLVDDYLELINPLWSTRELRGRIEHIKHETEDTPERLLLISAGSGITPIMSMLRHLDHDDDMNDVVVLHSARHTDDVIFGPELRELADRHEGFKLHEQLTRERGRMGPGDLDRLCPDWREREAYVSGPSDMLDAFCRHWEWHGDCERLHM